MMQMDQTKKIAVASTLLCAAALCLSTPALAQVAPLDVEAETSRLRGFFNGDSVDYSERFLSEIFGPVFRSPDGIDIEYTVFSRLVGYFNIFALVLGAILFFYNVSVGILQSAHEGSVLGQRWSSLWAPIRTILAVGLLVPLPNYGGYNAMQGGIAYMVKGSTQVASYVWSQAFDMIVGESMPISGGIARLDPNVAKQAFEMGYCRAIGNDQLEKADDPRRIEIIRVSNDNPTDSTPLYTGYGAGASQRGVNRLGYTLVDGKGYYSVLTSDGSTGAQYTNANICGSITIPETPEFLSEDTITEEAADALRTQYETTYLDAIGTVLGMSGAATAHGSGNAGMLNAASSRLDAFVANEDVPLVTNEIRSVLDAANQQLHAGLVVIASARNGVAAEEGQDFAIARERIRNHVTGGEDCVDGLTSDCHGEGWIGAGSWYMVIARINNEVLSLFSGTTTNIAQTFDATSVFGEGFGAKFWAFFTGEETEGNIVNQQAYELFAKYVDLFDESASSLAQYGVQIDTSTLASAMNPEAEGPSQAWGKWMDFILSNSDDFISFLASPTTYAYDPIIGLSVMGSWLVTIGSAVFVTNAILGLVGTFVASGPAAAVAGVLTGGAVLLITAGTTLSIVLPMLPFLFWILAVTGYFLLIAEAMVAAPMWAVAHMRMDGEGISGESARQGYMMVIALTLTPVLMVFGFVIGMMIFRVTSLLIQGGFSYALAGILGGNPIVAIFSLFVLSILMVLIYMVLLERSFSLISEFPSRVLNWIGSSAALTKGEEERIRLAAIGTTYTTGKSGNVIGRLGSAAGERTGKELIRRPGVKGK